MNRMKVSENQYRNLSLFGGADVKFSDEERKRRRKKPLKNNCDHFAYKQLLITFHKIT